MLTVAERSGYHLVAMKTDSVMRLQHKYGGKYVALKDGKVLAAARGLDRVMKKVASLKVQLGQIELVQVPPKDLVCVY